MPSYRHICQVTCSLIVQKYVNQIRQIPLPTTKKKTPFYFPIIRQQNSKICQMKMCEYLCKVSILDNLWHNDDYKLYSYVFTCTIKRKQ